MTVRILVSRDSMDRPWAPDYTHELEATQEIARRLWADFHHQQQLYTMMANLHDPSADLVFITERGIGIAELKNWKGRISVDNNGLWYADGKPIKSGKYPNPHQQVQAYAETVRQKILTFVLPKELKRDVRDWDSFKFQTTVCFTRTNVKLEEARQSIAAAPASTRKPWESDFSVTTLEELLGWVTRLRFEVDLGKAHRFEPYRLEPTIIANVATLCLGGTEWDEILSLMPTGEPYGYLVLNMGSDQTLTFNLLKDEILVGRDPDKCDVVIPKQYTRVSRVHARIIRSVAGVFLEDLSKHGTFMRGKAITQREHLGHNEIMTLGGPKDDGKVCSLKFLLWGQMPNDLQPVATISTGTSAANV